MSQSDPSDFEFDVSDLDSETLGPSPSDGGGAVSGSEETIEAEALAPNDPDREALEQSIETQRAALSEAVGEDDLDSLAGAGFDIAELPEIFSSPEALAAEEREARPVDVEIAPAREPASLRALGEDDLGADVFAELAAQDVVGEESMLDFEDALEDLLSEVDHFETGSADAGFADGAGSADEIGEDGLPLRPGQPDDDELTARQTGRAAGKIRPPQPPPAPEEPGGRVPLPADPESSRPLSFDTIPADPEPLAQVEAESEAAGIEADDFTPQRAEAPETVETTNEAPELEEPRAAGTESEFESEPETGPESAPEPTGLESAPAPEPVAESEPEPVALGDPDALAPTGEPGGAPAAPELQVFDGYDDAPEAEAPGAVDEPPAIEADEPAAAPEPASPPSMAVAGDEDDDDEIVAMPSAEDLLRQAGSLLNLGAPPAMEVEGEEDDDEIVALPDFAQLSEQLQEEPPAAGADADSEDEDGPLARLPDPETLIAQAAAQAAAEAGPAKPAGGNVADRGGNLPPPPPAPVEIIDDDPLDVDPAPYIPPPPESAATDEPEDSESVALKDPFAQDDALDGFNIGFDNVEDLEDVLSAQIVAGVDERDEEERARAGSGKPEVEEPAVPKPSLLWRLTHSLAVAAGLALVGLGWLLAVWKQEIMEYVDGRDLDASALVAEIRAIGSHALEGFDERGLYRLQWIDSELRPVSKNVIRLHARIAAQLREDLYSPVFDSYVEERFEIDLSLAAAARRAAAAKEIGELPEPPAKPWENLYQLATPKGEILLLRAVYEIARESAQADWKLEGVRLAGYDQDLEWPAGEPRSKFGDRAFDVDSAAFANALAAYRYRAENYVARVQALSDAEAIAAAEAARAADERRRRVRESMSKGAFFTGLAILGEDAAASEEVSMLITGEEGGGALLRGIFKREDADAPGKHFVGSLDFVSPLGGEEVAVLSVTTVAFEGQGSGSDAPPFFNPGTVSRIRLKTDGVQLEGDSAELSLRMRRAM